MRITTRTRKPMYAHLPKAKEIVREYYSGQLPEKTVAMIKKETGVKMTVAAVVNIAGFIGLRLNKEVKVIRERKPYKKRIKPETSKHIPSTLDADDKMMEAAMQKLNAVVMKCTKFVAKANYPKDTTISWSRACNVNLVDTSD